MIEVHVFTCMGSPINFSPLFEFCLIVPQFCYVLWQIAATDCHLVFYYFIPSVPIPRFSISYMYAPLCLLYDGVPRGQCPPPQHPLAPLAHASGCPSTLCSFALNWAPSPPPLFGGPGNLLPPSLGGALLLQ